MCFSSVFNNTSVGDNIDSNDLNSNDATSSASLEGRHTGCHDRTLSSSSALLTRLYTWSLILMSLFHLHLSPVMLLSTTFSLIFVAMQPFHTVSGIPLLSKVFLLVLATSPFKEGWLAVMKVYLMLS